MERPSLKSLRSPEHVMFRSLLVAARKKAGFTQVMLAKRLKRSQSFVSKYETGERRLDVIELIFISHILEFDAVGMVKEIAAQYKP